MRRPRRSCGDWEWVRRAGDAPELAVRGLNLEGGASGNGSLGGRGEGRAGAREVGLARGHGGHGADGGGGESSHLNRCVVLYCVCRYEVRRAAPDAFTPGLEKQLPVAPRNALIGRERNPDTLLAGLAKCRPDLQPAN